MPIYPNLDEFARGIALGRSRRSIARTLAILLPGLPIAATTAAKGKRGSGGKSKPKAKGKKGKQPARPQNPAPPPLEGPPDPCDATWPGENQQGDRDHCRFIRRQCPQGSGRHFCIRNGTKPDGTPTKVADCCNENQQCCGESCCDKDATCCAGRCCGAPPDFGCCGGRCYNLKVNHQHCGRCDNPCAPDEECVNATCVAKPTTCSSGARAVGKDGDCGETCWTGGPVCPGVPGDCCPAGTTCCDGYCAYTNIDEHNCGACGRQCRRPGGSQNEYCLEGECVCVVPGAVWADACGGCADLVNFHCCGNGYACRHTHDCVVLTVDGSGPHYGCIGKS
jgi:hypothetical protein